MNQMDINSKLSISEFILLKNDFKTYNKLIENSKHTQPNESLKLGINIEITNPKIEQIKAGVNYFGVSYNAKIRDGEDLVMEISSDYQMCLISNVEVFDNDEEIKKIESECNSFVGIKIMNDINGVLQSSVLKFTMHLPLSLGKITSSNTKKEESE